MGKFTRKMKWYHIYTDLHVFNDIIYDDCNSLVHLVHLKLINTKHSNLRVQYSFETQKFQHRARYRFCHPRKQQWVLFTNIHNISRRNYWRVHIKYTLMHTESCGWISIKMNVYFWYYTPPQPPGFQFLNTRPGPVFFYFINTHPEIAV